MRLSTDLKGGCEVKQSKDNKRRAGNAHTALVQYGAVVGSPMCSAEKPTLLTDLLVDLRHWADEHGVDFIAALEVSNLHYRAERKGEE
jgi:hypothetical protein